MIWPFYLMAIVAIIATVRVITNSNPMHALLSLIVSLLAVAGMFLTVGAPFVAALEVVVYAGAIMVLFVFVVMMLNLGKHTIEQEKSWLTASTWAVPLALCSVIAVVLVWMLSMTSSTGVMGQEIIPSKAVGTSLFTKYLLLTEVAGMLLLGAIIAASHLGKRQLNQEEEE